MSSGRVHVLVENAWEVHGLAASETHLYFTSYEGGKVRRAPLNGATAGSVLVSGQASPHAIGVVESTLFWTNLGTWASDRTAADGSIMRIGLGESSPTELATGLRGPIAMAADESDVYVANASGSIVAIKGTGGAVRVLASNVPTPVAIAVDRTHVYWTELGTMIRNESGVSVQPQSGSVRRVEKGGGATETMASRETEPTAVVLDDTSVYWIAGGAVRAAAKNGAGVIELAGSKSDRAAGLVADGARLLYSDRGVLRAMPTTTAVMTVDKGGGVARTLLSNSLAEAPAQRAECFDPAGLLVRDGHVYVADVGCGHILRVAL